MNTTEASPVEAVPAVKPLARVPRAWLRWSCVALASLGWWQSYTLYALSPGSASSGPLPLFCGGDAKGAGCGSVLASEYARMPLGSQPGALSIPVSALGMGYFAFVALWYLIIGCPTRSRWPWHFVIAAVVAVGCVQSLQYTSIMRDVLRQWCGACLSVHVINALLGLATVAAFPWLRERRPYEPHPRGRLVIAVFSAGAFLFLLHGAKATLDALSAYTAQLTDKYKRVVGDPAYVAWDYQRKPASEIAVEADRWLGPADAPNELVVFLDYQCSACRKAHDAIAAAIGRHPSALRVAYLNYPLDRSCNPHVEVGKHSHACRAATAAEAAFALGGPEAFTRMKRRLYDQANLAGVDFSALAGNLGMDRVAYDEAVASASVRAKLEADIELAHRLGVETTPALFLNGRRLDYWARDETWDVLLGQDAD